MSQPENYEWRHGTITYAESRNLAEYEQLLDIDRKDLDGKKILDLGSSQNLRVAQELQEAKINCGFFALSPDFSTKLYTPTRMVINTYPIAAIAQKLPFPDETFDYILDVGGPGIYAHDRKQMDVWIPESLRILKTNGKLISIFSALFMTNLMSINRNLRERGHEANYTSFLIKHTQTQTNFLREIIVKKSSNAVALDDSK